MERVALVTGGTGGIGTEICITLANSGHRVIANYHPAEQEAAEAWLETQKNAGLDMAIVAGDVSSFDSVTEMLGNIKESHGGVDVLVNCAGITRDKTLKKMEPANWESVINVNLNSVFNVTRQVVEGMLEKGFGRIINLSSVNGQRGQFGQANYSAAKAGMHGFTMAVAQETARKGITVNTVSPGYIETQMTAIIPEDVRNQIVAGIPMARMGQPKEIADVIDFIASDKAAYITGANIPINGGLFMSF